MLPAGNTSAQLGAKVEKEEGRGNEKATKCDNNEEAGSKVGGTLDAMGNL